VHREALKVFLKFLKTFSSEKVFKPPEALAAKPRTGARQYAIAGAKGLENGQSPNSSPPKDFRERSRDFGGSMPPKSPWLRRSPVCSRTKSGDYLGAVQRAAEVRRGRLRFFLQDINPMEVGLFYSPT